jgi:D-glutamate cyclase-like protein
VRPEPDPIDHVLGLDLGARGIASFFLPGAAARAAQALHGARRALIATGFLVAPDTPETDGPPGAAVLGRALRRLGAQVRYVTDPAAVTVLGAALESLGERADVLAYPATDDAARAVLARESPSHLIAIERPGRTRAGEYLNLRGLPVTAWNVPLDDLFLENDRLARDGRGGTRGARVHARIVAPSRTAKIASAVDRRRSARSGSVLRRATTIGIGDGGNEIGMGNVHARLARQGGVIARTASIVRVDHLIVAATSNWGAYGLVVALERLSARELLHTPAMERRLVEACVAAGAVDGVTKRRDATVDGLPLDAHAAVVELLRLVPKRPPAGQRAR